MIACAQRMLCMCRIRDKIDKLMQKDRALSLLVAMESALEDERFEVQNASNFLHCLVTDMQSSQVCMTQAYIYHGKENGACLHSSCHACTVQEAMRLRDAFKAMTGGCQGAFTVEGIIDV